jgi:hypothetical protein
MRKANRAMKHRFVGVNLHLANPVAKPYGVAEIGQHIRTLRVQVYVQPDGAECTAVLARLAWILGMAAEAELAANGPTPALRKLHGALRTVQGMCLAGYRWNVPAPAGLELALVKAEAVLLAHPLHAAAAMPGAQYLFQRIEAHQVTPEDVAGAEIYNDTEGREAA